MLETIRKKYRERPYVVCFVVFFLLSLFQFSYYGAKYYFQLDDYIQFYNYLQGPRWETIMALHLFQSRPLAVLLDMYIWGPLYDHMWLAVVGLTCLMTISGVVFYAFLRRHFKTGPFFLVCYALFPMRLEGVYWCSAATRVVMVMFFCALSVWFLDSYAETKKKRHLTFFLVFQLMSFGFYEQAIPLSLALTAVTLFLRRKQLGKRSLFALFSFVNVAIYFGFCSLMSPTTGYSNRADIILPTTLYYFKILLPQVLDQFVKSMISSSIFITVKGFVRGVQILLADRAVAYILILIAVSLCAFFWIRRQRREERPVKEEAAEQKVRPLHNRLLYPMVGVIFTLAPSALFLFLSVPWICVRSTALSFVGLAILCDWLLGVLVLLFKRHQQAAYATLSAALMLVFLTASVSELHDYKGTYENDQRVLAAIESVYDPALSNVAFLGVEPSYLEDQNYFYHEHIHGVTESWWALSGALAAYSTSGSYTATPIRTEGNLYSSSANLDMTTYDDFYYIDKEFNIYHINMEMEDEIPTFYFDDGTLLGHFESSEIWRQLILEEPYV